MTSNYILTIKLEYKYKAEYIEVHFDSNRTSCQDAQYTSQEARKGSRMLALHSGIEDPPSKATAQPTIQSHHTNNTTTNTTTSSSNNTHNQVRTEGNIPGIVKTTTRHRKVIEDDEDIEYKVQLQLTKQKEKEEALLLAQKAVEDAKKTPDFGFHYSIDAEKRSFGAAVELLALPTDRDLGNDDGRYAVYVLLFIYLSLCYLVVF